MTTPLQDTLRALYLRAVRTRHPHSVAVCEVDKFHAYERGVGHEAAASALASIAEAARNAAPPGAEVYVSEGAIVVVFPDLTLREAWRATEPVVAAVEKLGITRDDGGVLTLSAGIAEVEPARDRTPADWLARADAALCGAKADGTHLECMS
jgi:diguanylate cyclase (GGDEF)-like protein